MMTIEKTNLPQKNFAEPGSAALTSLSGRIVLAPFPAPRFNGSN
jgi:hypothetical protein